MRPRIFWAFFLTNQMNKLTSFTVGKLLLTVKPLTMWMKLWKNEEFEKKDALLYQVSFLVTHGHVKKKV